MTRVEAVHRATHTNAAASVAFPEWAVPAILAASGGLALALGLLVYLADRVASHAMLIPTITALGNHPLFGVLGQWLPSFVHPLAFSLFTAAVRSFGSSPPYWSCAAWWTVNAAFEAAQHPQIRGVIVERLHGAVDFAWLTRPLENYLLRGTFDVGDLIAATAGALCAAAVLNLVHRLEVRHVH